MHYALLLILALLAVPATAQDLDKGKEINGTCAGCHGEYGAGGKKGEYPRIAGQRAAYIEHSLRSFRARTRINIPMFPYTQERELHDEDIRDVAAYLTSIELPTKWPEFKDTDDALARLTATEKVMIIPRVDGNLDNGKDIFQKQCASCHGKTAKGRGKFPMLVGQYTNYLMRQMEAYIRGERAHDEDNSRGILATLKPSDLQDILAYVTTLQDPQE
ncbi:MAG: c-type cytochrome [Gammaproteobacteria bacterium]|nr:c-type cytochrome [Gammaproteobacteria bacterium]MBU1646406.1 c-type cytochrome [Gammaproteobacteria bacterium]MBU1970949.1 c-type cytochrome [Gammaproteobacteria bacterium]